MLVVARHQAPHSNSARPGAGEAGERLGGGGDVLDQHAGRRPARGSRRRGPSGGRRRCGTRRRAAPRAGSSGRPVLGDVAAEPVELGGQRGEPVGLVAADVGRRRAGATGTSASGAGRRPRGSARRRRAGRVDAPQRARAGDGQALVGELRGPPSGRGSRAARRRPGWCARGQSGTVTRPPVTSAAARNGAALDRSGSTATSTARTGRAHPPAVRRRCRRRRRRAAAAARRSCRCAAARAPACRRGARRRPRRTGRRPAAAPRRTGSTPTRRS